MKTEALLFAGVALFFGINAAGYGWYSSEPAGTVALVVAALMASLISFFCATHYRRRGLRPQDRREAEVMAGAGPVEFLPPHSPWPVVSAAAAVVMSLGVVFGLWLFIIGVGLLAPAVFGFVFQYADRGRQRSSSSGSGGSPGRADGSASSEGPASNGGAGMSTRSR